MKEQIMEILKKINPRITEDADLLEGGLIDSFEIVNLVTELEETLQIEIDPELILSVNFQSVDSIVKLVERIRRQ